MGNLRGIIRLSYRQAEGRQTEIAVLCLKYMVTLAAAAAIAVLWMRHYGAAHARVMLLCAFGAAMAAVRFRTLMHYGMYCVSENYLHTGSGRPAAAPGSGQLWGFGVGYCAAVCSVWGLLLLPSLLCLRFGAQFYALSGRREPFMLMTCASMCLLLGGVLLSVVVSARLGCAEYLFFSGECGSVLSALDCSWQVTHDGGGDLLLLQWMTWGRRPGISTLCRLNLSEKLAAAFAESIPPAQLYLEWRRERGGEQRIELAFLK